MSESECAVCFGHWEEDDADEWLTCTNEKCDMWSCADCLEKVMMHTFASCVKLVFCNVDKLVTITRMFPYL